MIQIYHNPRCKKSREGLQFLEESEIDFEIIKYLDQPPSTQELTSILDKLDLEPIELVRTNEKIWKDNYKAKSLSNDQIIEAMIKNPKLIERPIVINGDKAAIGRPLENIKAIV